MQEIARLEFSYSNHDETFPLSDIRDRVNQYCKDNNITIDTFFDIVLVRQDNNHHHN
ncbi:hypothetical protein [Pseudoalteromonas mariniglutinosa]|uniref:hypothetical protein n=1 Tax=Pseudoalteromonas mariniglutinosa TaxID=206042 RepID=UPI00385095AA